MCMVLTGTQAELSCTVVVLNSYGSANLTNSYTYKSSLTPVITDVSPRRGGTAGGTLLTVTGRGFRSGIIILSSIQISLQSQILEPFFNALNERVMLAWGSECKSICLQEYRVLIVPSFHYCLTKRITSSVPCFLHTQRRDCQCYHRRVCV